MEVSLEVSCFCLLLTTFGEEGALYNIQPVMKMKMRAGSRMNVRVRRFGNVSPESKFVVSQYKLYELAMHLIGTFLLAFSNFRQLFADFL